MDLIPWWEFLFIVLPLGGAAFWGGCWCLAKLASNAFRWADKCDVDIAYGWYLNKLRAIDDAAAEAYLAQTDAWPEKDWGHSRYQLMDAAEKRVRGAGCPKISNPNRESPSGFADERYEFAERTIWALWITNRRREEMRHSFYGTPSQRIVPFFRTLVVVVSLAIFGVLGRVFVYGVYAVS